VDVVIGGISVGTGKGGGEGKGKGAAVTGEGEQISNRRRRAHGKTVSQGKDLHDYQMRGIPIETKCIRNQKVVLKR
jgi:hypothetical protein